MPVDRALGGRELRNSRVARERIEKGLNLAFTSVINRVIIAAGVCVLGTAEFVNILILIIVINGCE